MRNRWLWRTVAMVSVVGIVASACGKKAANNPTTVPPTTASSSPTSAVVKGGNLVLGAEQYPECLNVVTQCASASWLFWSSTMWVMPRAMMWGLDGKPTNSPLLTEVPTLDNGGLTSSPFTVRFKINPQAVWADGTPITCADFDFTRDAILNSKGTYGTAGYEDKSGPGISSIDCSDPATAVLQFSAPYTDWTDIFGGGTGYVLEKAAFPNEDPAKAPPGGIDNTPKVDVSPEMQDLIPFSGGPWKMQSWSTEQTVFVPNDKYWGHKPNFDKVTIVPRTDQTTEINDLLSGTLDAIFPQPDVSLISQFKTQPAVKYAGSPGNYYEGLWMNLSKPPFNDIAVRQAFFYAVDRQKVMDNLITPMDATQTTPLGCGAIAFPGGFWCDQTPFAQFKYDTTQVDSIMTGAGYAKDSKGFWAKGGTELSILYYTTTKPRRIQTQAILKDELVAAGFNVTTKALDPTLLFETKLPHGDFEVADFAEGGTPDPSITATFGCDYIPTAANNFSGANDFHWCNPDATNLMKQSDTTLDPTQRRSLLDQVYAAEVKDFAPMLPLYVLPNLTAWRSDKIAGPIDKWVGTVYGSFFNADEWYCVSAGACT